MMYHKNKYKFHSREMNFDATKLPDEINIDDDKSEGYSNNDSISATSTNCSCSSMSYNIIDNQLFIQPVHGQTSDYLENVAASSTNIGSITAQNGTDITIGNKIFFNAPVEIKQLVVDHGERNVDAIRSCTELAHSKLPWSARTQHYFVNHPCKVCAAVSAVTMMVATLIIAGCYFDPFERKVVCEENPSDPTFYSCGFPSACGRCKAMYSQREICSATYDHSCGDLRCFCKPQCLSKDCQV